ncbi:MAG: hypothetical protein A2X86_17625 [Bdellovibrionales bacterium GWA2_49_15]|nr:MAG: hypothetical protein A2X86_17625 [Bdellovibrionales bacterium GWA2_49_15]
MQTEFVPEGPYEDIINLLGQWKVLDMKSLSELNNFRLGYHNLLKKVRKLEQEGMIKGVSLGGKNKHIFLTQKGFTLTNYDQSYPIADENVAHDLIVGTVLRTFCKFSGFYNGKMFHQISADEIFPDAAITGTRDNENYQLAIEVELTQKSQDRIKEKFRRYAKGNSFHYVLFITNKETLFKTYCRFLGEMNAEVQKAVILLLDKELSMSKFNHKESRCLYMGEEKNFRDLFGV